MTEQELKDFALMCMDKAMDSDKPDHPPTLAEVKEIQEIKNVGIPPADYWRFLVVLYERHLVRKQLAEAKFEIVEQVV